MTFDMHIDEPPAFPFTNADPLIVTRKIRSKNVAQAKQ